MSVFGFFIDLYIIIMIASYNFLAHDKHLRAHVLFVNSLILIWFTSLDLILINNRDSIVFGYAGMIGSTFGLLMNAWMRWQSLEEKKLRVIDV